MPLFDSYIFVDWSAKNKKGPQNPAEDEIWIGELTSSTIRPEKYCRSRMECKDYLYDRLGNLIKKGLRVLLGFDFPYGYPKGLSNALGFDKSHSWQRIWKELCDNIEDIPENTSNRFKVANDLNIKVGGVSPG